MVSDASYHAMTTPMPLRDGTELEYAMGLGVGERAGSPVISHGGGINGFLTDGRYYPDDDLTVVVLSNPPGQHPSDMAQQIGNWALETQ